METKAKLSAIAKAASEKKAGDVVIIDMRKMPSLGDYYLIASGASGPQVSAIAEHVINRLRDEGQRPRHVEQDSGKTWILVDYGDVIVHVFHEATRALYNLERLWGDAPQRRSKTLRPARKKVHGRTKKKRKRRAA